MSKVFESIYAYKELYFDAYYKTPDLDENEEAIVAKVAAENDRKTQLENIKNYNVSLKSGQIEAVDNYYILSKIKLNDIEPEIRFKLNLRGNEIIHSLFIPKEDINDLYLIDFLNEFDVDDIPYVFNEDKMKYELENVNVAPTDIKQFNSDPSVDASNLDNSILTKLINAFLFSIERGKKLIITCEYDDIDILRQYVKTIIKLFPPKIANQINYNDCNGGLDNIRFDIVIMPKQKNDVSFNLKQKGFYIEFSTFGIQDVIPNEYLLAKVIDRYGIYEIKSRIERYVDSINNALDADKIFKIINNKNTDISSDEANNFYSYLINKIGLINDCFDDITMIKTAGSDGEIYDQLISFGQVISSFKAQFYGLDLQEINNILDILFVIKKKLIDKNLNCEIINSILIAILLAIGENDPYNNVRFNLITRSGYKYLNELLSYSDILEIIGKNWIDLKQFFDEFFKDQSFSGAYVNVCEMMIDKLEDCNQQYYFIYIYLNFADDNRKLVTLKNIVTDFDKNKDLVFDLLIDTKLNLFDTFIKIVGSFDDERIDKIFRYYLMKYNEASFDNASRIEEIIKGNNKNGLLSMVIKPLKDKSFNTFYEDFSRINNYIMNSYNKTATNNLIRDYYLDVVISNVVNSLDIDFKVINFDNKDIYKQRIDEVICGYNIRSDNLSIEFVKYLEKLENDIDIYVEQKSRRLVLYNFRLNFVEREFELLDNYTIVSLLKKHIGKEKFYKHFEKNSDSKIIKSENFIEKSKELLREFLDNPDVKNQEKKELVKEIRERKDAITKLVIIKGFIDVTSFIFKAAIFMAIIVALTGVSCYFLYKYVSLEFFLLPYIVFAIASGAIALLIFWFNYKDRGIKNIYIKSFIQVVIIVIFMISLYLGSQKLMEVMTNV